jgi:excisionase family DNA binding protein
MSRSTVYELAKAGVLPSVRVGRRIRFDRDKVIDGRSGISPNS